MVIAIVKPGSNSPYVPTLSEFLVFKVLLQFSLQNSSQFFKVLVVQATVSHKLNALGGGEGEGFRAGLIYYRVFNMNVTIKEKCPH